jgi:hypothetical protein
MKNKIQTAKYKRGISSVQIAKDTGTPKTTAILYKV